MALKRTHPMTDKPLFAFVAGLLGTLTVASCLHLMGFSPAESAEYLYSNFLFHSGVLYGLAYFAVSIILGFFFRNAWAIATGMVLPMPVALVLEVSANSSTHNLLPFEVLFFWLPAFFLAILGSRVGNFLADWAYRRQSRD